MEKIRAVIIDDEESARDVLSNLLLRFCPEIELIGKYSNIPDAVGFIKSEKPSLVFLDIEMPVYAGYEIVNFFDEIPFEIVFVTAYDKYALRAFEISAMDYLLKPINIDRLKESVERVTNAFNLKLQIEKLDILKNTIKSKSIDKIMVLDKGYSYAISLSEIIAIEAQESYSLIHTDKRKYTVSKNLKHYEELFEEDSVLIRVHKSWIVNKNFIQSYSKSEFSIKLKGGLEAKLSKYKKAEFEALL